MVVKEPKEAISLLEAAHRLGWGRDKAYRLARAGRFPGLFRPDSRSQYQVSVVALDAYLRDPGKYGE